MSALEGPLGPAAPTPQPGPAAPLSARRVLPRLPLRSTLLRTTRRAQSWWRRPESDRLRQIPLFADLPKRTRRAIESLVVEVRIPAGTALTRERAHSAEFMVILAGVVEVRRRGEVVAKLGPGDFLGEVGMLAKDQRRTATAVALTPVHALDIGPREFSSLLALSPEIRERIEATARGRAPRQDLREPGRRAAVPHPWSKVLPS